MTTPNPDTLTKGCSILASISLQCLKVLSPFWTTSLRCCDSSPTHNHSGLYLIRAITMADGCHLANRFRLEPNDYEVVSPLVTPPWCRLVVPASCCNASCCPLIVPPSCCLVAPAGCPIASRRSLIALPSRHLVAAAGCRIASRRPLIVPPSRQLVAPACCRITSPCPLVAPRAAVSSSCRASWLLRCLWMRPLVVSSRQLVVAPSSLVVLSLHCHLILSSCWLVAALPVHHVSKT